MSLLPLPLIFSCLLPRSVVGPAPRPFLSLATSSNAAFILPLSPSYLRSLYIHVFRLSRSPAGVHVHMHVHVMCICACVCVCVCVCVWVCVCVVSRTLTSSCSGTPGRPLRMPLVDGVISSSGSFVSFFKSVSEMYIYINTFCNLYTYKYK